jgi:hypothetical protein
MSIIRIFAIGAGLAFLISLGVAVVLRPHLARLLEELCGSRSRARFWMVTCILSLLLLGMLGGTSGSGYPDLDQPSPRQLLFGLVYQVRFSLIALLSGLMTVAWLLLEFIRRLEKGLIPAPLTEPPARVQAIK